MENGEQNALTEIKTEQFNDVATTSLAVNLTRAEIDQAIATAKAYPRSLKGASDAMVAMATFNAEMAEDCIYSLPRGGKQIRGPSIRFAEIVAANWGNNRHSARVTHVDRIERKVEAEAAFFDLQTNVASVARVNRTIELKRGKTAIDLDMIQLAGAAAMQIARRNAILGGVPRIVWGPAHEAVEDVIRGDLKTLAERRDRAVAYFTKANIPIEKVAKALGRDHIEDIDLDDLVTMTGWRSAIKSGEVQLDELFPDDKPVTERKNLAAKMDALSASPAPSSDAPAELPPSPGAGEGSVSPAQEPSPPVPVEAASIPSTELPAAEVGRSTSAVGATPEPEPPPAKPAGRQTKAEAARAAIQAAGDEAAAKGHDALMEWFDNLSGDQSALISPAMEKKWREAVEL